MAQRSHVAAISKQVHGFFWDDTDCRWEKRDGKSLAFVKRRRARTVRHRLADDLRHEINDDARIRASKKRTRRWCKGVVGRDHTLRLTNAQEVLGYGDWARSIPIDQCARCGKRYWRSDRTSRRSKAAATIAALDSGFTGIYSLNVTPWALAGSEWEIVQTSGPRPVITDRDDRVVRARRSNTI